MSTKSTKRTTANIATDLNGRVIRLLTTRLTADKGYNTLLYKEVRSAVASNDNTVIVLTGNRCEGYQTPMQIRRSFERVTSRAYLGVNELAAYKEGPIFSIGCHYFTLKMFNRILRAAGIRTTKPQTLKRFAAAA